jgi:hypothetical protein
VIARNGQKFADMPSIPDAVLQRKYLEWLKDDFFLEARRNYQRSLEEYNERMKEYSEKMEISGTGFFNETENENDIC